MRFYLKALLTGAIILTLFAAGCSKDSEQSANQMLNVSVEQFKSGELAKAEENAQKALNLMEQQHSMLHPALVEPLHILALIYQEQNKFLEAEQSYKRAINILQSSEGENSQAVYKVMNNLGALYYAQQKYEQSLNISKQSLSIANKYYSSDDPQIQKIKKNIKACQAEISGDPLPDDTVTADNRVGGILKNADNQGQIQAPADDNTPAKPSQSAPQDLLPDKVKQTVLDKLAKQNIHLYNLRPMAPVKIGAQGAVLPYRCKQKAADKDKGAIEAVLLFATVQNDETGGFILKQCRMVSYDSYMEEVNSQMSLIKSLKEVFPKVYS